MKLSFFDDVPAVLSYITTELVATLHDDADDCERARDLAQAAELRAKIDDIEAVTPLLNAAPDLLAALKGLFEHCAMVHKSWGEDSNQRESEAAQEQGRAAIDKAME